MTVKVGSRESALAVAQAELVIRAIRKQSPGLEVELITMKTTGDKRLDTPLDRMGGKEVFVRELEQALLDGRVDICVHSLKDVSVEGNPALPLVAMGRREDPADVLVLPEGKTEPDLFLPVGCSSKRRAIQLEGLLSGVRIEPVRGNVLTRLAKLDGGGYGALVLAAAGLRRLGLEERISRRFTPEEMLPACGQGILAVQGRAGEDTSWLEGFRDRDAWHAATAERACIRELSGGCTSPVTAFAEFQGDRLVLRAYNIDRNGNRIYGSRTGPRQDAERLGTELGQWLKTEAERA